MRKERVQSGKGKKFTVGSSGEEMEQKGSWNQDKKRLKTRDEDT